MPEEKTMVVNDGETIKITSASRMPTVSASPTPSANVTAKTLEVSDEDLNSLVPIEKQYVVSEQIAEGGQGTIHLARDKSLKREVAVKSLKSTFLSNREVIDSFVTEARITSQLEHPAIIPLHSINSSENAPGFHIAMKMIRGRNLREIMDDAVLRCKELRRSCRLKQIADEFLKERMEDFVKVCDAVAFAHDKGVVHRDIKPSNIMIGEFHEVYVMDWGIAAVAEDGRVPNKLDADGKPQIAGTPGFIAPEVVVGGEHTTFSDQYALGIILFEIATMAPAITGSNIQEIFEKTRDAKLEPLTHRFPRCEIHGDLKAIVRKATAPNPKDRYATVSDLSADVRRFLAGNETEARPDNIPRRISRWFSKHSGLAAALTLSFLLLCAGLAIFALVKRNAAIRESKRRSLLLTALQSEAESQAHFIDKHYFHIAHFLDRFAWAARECLTEPRGTSNPLFLNYTSFSPGVESAPPDLTPAKAYENMPVSLSFGAVKAPPDLADSEKLIQESASRLTPLAPLMFRLLVYSDPNHFPKSDKEARERALSIGYPIAWIYLALSNGLIFNFPGHSDFPKSYDPRTRIWYKEAMAAKRIVWSNPYKDSFGRGLVVTASKAVRGAEGKTLGVVGIDTTFAYIVSVLFNSRDKDEPWCVGRYLLDADGKVLISSSLDEAEKESASSTLEFPPFPYVQIYSHLERGDSGQFEVDDDGAKLLVVYAPVETMGWHFAEVVRLDEFLASSMSKKRDFRIAR